MIANYPTIETCEPYKPLNEEQSQISGDLNHRHHTI